MRGLLSALAAALAFAAPAAAAPAEFGVNANRVFQDSFDGDRWNLHLSAIRATGVRLVRNDAYWEAAEPDPPQDGVHTYDWTYLDFVAIAMANHELRWAPILDYSALWASSVPGDDHAPPKDADDYAAYAAAFARRYGRGGSLWDEFDPKAEPPVTTYEIWNEPNLDVFWRPAPDPARYMELYAKARAAIKAVDPDAVVLVGGLVPGTGFERALYATRPDAAAIVDGVAFHPYAATVDGVLREVRNLRRTLEEVGDPEAPIHITELGWVTNPPEHPLYVSEEQRAANLEQAMTALAWSDCGVATVIPYTWATPESDPGNAEDWYGIRDPDGAPTRSSDAFARAVAAPPRQAERICHPPDADADTRPDADDPDDDNDGVPDVSDAFPPRRALRRGRRRRRRQRRPRRRQRRLARHHRRLPARPRRAARHRRRRQRRERRPRRRRRWPPGRRRVGGRHVPAGRRLRRRRPRRRDRAPDRPGRPRQRRRPPPGRPRARPDRRPAGRPRRGSRHQADPLPARPPPPDEDPRHPGRQRPRRPHRPQGGPRPRRPPRPHRDRPAPP
ncbi:MAG: hypothetical protein M3340_04400 [Actinomycetota bacterium]|nr:hypothetical protein [Actinomycetota bacterium]